MMMKLVLLLFCVASTGLTLSVSAEFVSDSLERYGADDEFLSFGYIEMRKALNCSYRVIISASCSSPNFTMENIAIRFGDPYGNQVFEPRLAVPSSRKFEQCSLDIFQINGGACPSPICFVNLYRYGAKDGWKPERVQIYGKNILPLNLDFSSISQPSGWWFGFNWCSSIINPFINHHDINEGPEIMVSFVETVVNKSGSKEV